MAFSRFSCLRLFFDERKVRQPLTALWYKRGGSCCVIPIMTSWNRKGNVELGVDHPPFEDDMWFIQTLPQQMWSSASSARGACVCVFQIVWFSVRTLAHLEESGTRTMEDLWHLLVMDESCEQQERTGETGWWDALCVWERESVAWATLAGGVRVDAARWSWWRGDGGRVGVVLPAVVSLWRESQ